MILHNLDLSKTLKNWTYRQKVIFHAVMGNMAIMIYGEEGKRNEENDYVKFALDVLTDFTNTTSSTDIEGNITIANWSLESYIQDIDHWFQEDLTCENKELYNAKANALTVILGAFQSVPLLQQGEVDALLDGLKTNKEYDYFSSEKIFDYCNMLFIEGMKVLHKIVPLDNVQSHTTTTDHTDYHPENADERFVRRTILWNLDKRVLLQAVCGHLVNIISYEWPRYKKSREYFSQATYIMKMFCKGAPLRVVNSAVNVGTILVDNLLLDVIKCNEKGLYKNRNFDVAEMFLNTLQLAIDCIYDMPDEYATYIVNHITFNSATLLYDSHELQLLINQILDFSEGLANHIK